MQNYRRTEGLIKYDFFIIKLFAIFMEFFNLTIKS